MGFIGSIGASPDRRREGADPRAALEFAPLMTQFLISALGSAGDVHPFIAIAQALQARGHDVRMLSSPYFAERIDRAGIAFAAMGAPGDYERVLQRPELWQGTTAARFILDELLQRLPEGYAATAALARPGTVLVGSTLSWGLRLVQEVQGLSAATIHLSPICIQSAIAPPVLPGVGDLSWLPTGIVRALQTLAERAVLDRWIGPRLNRLRAELGLAPVTRIWSRWMHSPDCVIGAWPEWFAPVRADWPAQASTSGFPVFDEGGAGLDPSLAAYLAGGSPPVGVTPGSAMAHGRAFFERAIAAGRASDRRLLLITPFREQLPERLPDGAHHVAYAPFSALLPRLSALVHHGGIGTSAQALAAGLPQLVVPFAHDQFDNAARLRRLGVARSVSVGASAARWTVALDRLTDGSDGATVRRAVRAAATRMADGGPAAHDIAHRLETLAPRR